MDHDRGYPEEFIDALTAAGWLAVMIPEDYGGLGLGLAKASVVIDEVNRCGGNAGACRCFVLDGRKLDCGADATHLYVRAGPPARA